MTNKRSNTFFRFADILGRSGHFAPQFIRFIFVGLLNTLFGQGVFVGLVLLGLNHQIALLIATIVGVLFNFQTTGTLVFRTSERRLLLRYVACYVFAYVLNAALLGVMVRAGLSPILAQSLLILPMAVIVFLVSRQFVFVAPR